MLISNLGANFAIDAIKNIYLLKNSSSNISMKIIILEKSNIKLAIDINIKNGIQNKTKALVNRPTNDVLPARNIMYGVINKYTQIITKMYSGIFLKFGIIHKEYVAINERWNPTSKIIIGLCKIIKVATKNKV